jgi:hypothetical protein
MGDTEYVSHLRKLCKGKHATDAEIHEFIKSKMEQNSQPTSSTSSGTLIMQNEFNLGVFMKELFMSYKWYLSNYPVRTKAVTAATISCLGEVLGAYVKSRVHKRKFRVEGSRLLLFAGFGSIITGPLLHFWYILLEGIMHKMNLTGRGKVIAKVLFDRILWSPPFTVLTLCYLQYFQTFSVHETAVQLRRNYFAVLVMSQKTWFPAQLVNFELVPQEFQVLFVNLVAVFWNTYLSMAN